jgi:PP-loop superfamily ATP-utilizing enzyme
MPNQINYHDIAKIQLHEAINLYDQENYICAVTLAGASEEILSKLVLHYSDADNLRSQTLNNFQNKYPDITVKELNLGRNMLKHIMEDACEKDINLKHYAEAYILLSIGDYFTLQEKITKIMSDFWNTHSDEILNRKFESEAA